MTAANPLEARLELKYREQLICYQKARGALEQIAPLSTTTWVGTLQSALEQVAAIEAEIGHEKLTWQRENYTPGPVLRGLLEEIAACIKELTLAIDRQSAELEARKARLLPTMDAFIQNREMINRYEQFSKCK